MKTLLRVGWLSAVLVYVLVTPVQSQQLLTNGDFEPGFAGWTRLDQAGSDGTWALQSGTVSPVNGFVVPAPPGPTHAAMTDSQAGGTHVLYQDFTVPLTLSVATLRFDLYINNHANAFFSPASLDFSTPTLNQQFRVDIITTAADPFSVTVADVLMNAYRTQPGDPLVSGYTTVTVDLTSLFASHLGETLRLRFAEVDNVNFMNVGVDRISLSIPEPSTFATLLSGLGLLGAFYARSRRRRRCQ
jgi:hypothetical protein